MVRSSPRRKSRKLNKSRRKSRRKSSKLRKSRCKSRGKSRRKSRRKSSRMCKSRDKSYHKSRRKSMRKSRRKSRRNSRRNSRRKFSNFLTGSRINFKKRSQMQLSSEDTNKFIIHLEVLNENLTEINEELTEIGAGGGEDPDTQAAAVLDLASKKKKIKEEIKEKLEIYGEEISKYPGLVALQNEEDLMDDLLDQEKDRQRKKEQQNIINLHDKLLDATWRGDDGDNDGVNKELEGFHNTLIVARSTDLIDRPLNPLSLIEQLS